MFLPPLWSKIPRIKLEKLSLMAHSGVGRRAGEINGRHRRGGVQHQVSFRYCYWFLSKRSIFNSKLWHFFYFIFPLLSFPLPQWLCFVNVVDEHYMWKPIFSEWYSAVVFVWQRIEVKCFTYVSYDIVRRHLWSDVSGCVMRSVQSL